MCLGIAALKLQDRNTAHVYQQAVEHVGGIQHQAQQYVLVRGALAKGLLAGKPARPYLNWQEEEIQALQQQLRKAAGDDQAGWAMSFALRPPAAGSIVLGASSPAQLEQAISSWERVQEVEMDWLVLEGLVPAQKYVKHR